MEGRGWKDTTVDYNDDGNEEDRGSCEDRGARRWRIDEAVRGPLSKTGSRHSAPGFSRVGLVEWTRVQDIGAWAEQRQCSGGRRGRFSWAMGVVGRRVGLFLEGENENKGFERWAFGL
ncbi:hypothetical protein CABS01_10778 [Colletotrichum abscissum]|uniref:Uncharacterized protein n=1 Tax=Colletotrichum abscissum TaxID=1671311 RepID=A0A9P9XN85_9PEZI|nr:uncharacterized protein CABS01_10778 [Colletotrichum abscissum]KAI3557366.1 hypothetical protein CABS02_02470 [Colletotrichum abscissum]KAK1497800.1 hypothetical protein CABS01_10778 [Colletotrichum abscissum]